MSVGDAVGGNITVPAGGNAGITPQDGTTWLITNLSLIGPFNLALAANSNAAYGVVSTASSSTVSYMNNLVLYCNASSYWVIYNTDSVAHSFEYNGIVINDGTNGAIAVAGLGVVNAGNYFTIQPPAGQEWEINYVLATGDGNLFWKPSNKTIISSINGNLWITALKLAISNSHYLNMQNQAGATYYYAFAGRRTK